MLDEYLFKDMCRRLNYSVKTMQQPKTTVWKGLEKKIVSCNTRPCPSELHVEVLPN